MKLFLKCTWDFWFLFAILTTITIIGWLSFQKNPGIPFLVIWFACILVVLLSILWKGLKKYRRLRQKEDEKKSDTTEKTRDIEEE